MSATIDTSVGTKPIDPYKATNYESPPVKEKVDDLVKFITDIKFGMLTTKASDSSLLASRCMSLADTEGGGIDLVFHTNLFTGKTTDLTVHPQETNMSFLDPSSGSWASVSGVATIHSDRETVARYYTPELKIWLGDLGDGVHDGGPSDPRIGVIRLESRFITYAVVKKGLMGRAVDLAKSSVRREVPAINKIRELTGEELSGWRHTLRQ